jgi:hypothetical protein
MKAILFSVFCLFLSFQVSAQKDEMSVMKGILAVSDGEENTLYSIPNYDSLGNVFQVKKKFDHKPNFKDSLEFSRIIPIELRKMFQEYELAQEREMNSMKKNNNPKKKAINKKRIN